MGVARPSSHERHYLNQRRQEREGLAVRSSPAPNGPDEAESLATDGEAMSGAQHSGALRQRTTVS
jgi:hypothetical protein